MHLLTSESWFAWAVLSMVCYGLQSFLYKIATEKGGDGPTVQVMMPIVVCTGGLLALSLHSGSEPSSLWLLVLFAVLQGVFFFLTTFFRLAALEEGTPTNVVFPALKTSTVVVVILSALLLDEWESLKQPGRLVGVVLAMVSTFILAKLPPPSRGARKGVTYAAVSMLLIATLASAGASLMAKGVFSFVGDVDVFLFIICSNMVTMVSATSIVLWKPRPRSFASYRRGVLAGALIGVLNFVGFVAFMWALESGELSVVASINALYILIPIVLGSLVYHERMSAANHVAVALTILAMALLAT